MEKNNSRQYKKKEFKIQSVYSRNLLSRKVVLPITNIGKNLIETLEENIKQNYEGKCVEEGYIKLNSTHIISHSCGIIQRGNNILFDVVFECFVCFLVNGMLISCVAKNVTKTAGIRAEIANEVPSPIVVFLAKDHHYLNTNFGDIQEGDKITVKVIGQRFELNDKYISAIGELTKEKEFKIPIKPKLIIQED